MSEPRPSHDSGAGRDTDLAPLEQAYVVPDLPWAYDDDRCVLLVRDPQTLYVYWDLHPDTVRRAGEGLGPTTAHLRLYDVTTREPREAAEHALDLGWRSYYLTGLEPNRDYRVELVLRGAGEERVLRRSNAARLPPNEPSAWVEDRFASIPLDVRLPAAGLFATGRLAGPDADRRLHARAWELSGGDLFETRDEVATSSSPVPAKGFGGRPWSGTLVRK